jgi:hypothetical protein
MKAEVACDLGITGLELILVAILIPIERVAGIEVEHG